jgi:flagellar basal body-associated protein FliL
MKNIYWVLIVIAIIITGAIIWYASTTSQNRNQNADQNQTKTVTKENCISDECLTTKEEVIYPVSTLPKNIVDALNKAIG